MMKLDDELEVRIDRMGRERVFNYARSRGLTIAPPKWVWEQILADLAASNSEQK